MREPHCSVCCLLMDAARGVPRSPSRVDSWRSGGAPHTNARPRNCRWPASASQPRRCKLSPPLPGCVPLEEALGAGLIAKVLQRIGEGLHGARRSATAGHRPQPLDEGRQGVDVRPQLRRERVLELLDLEAGHDVAPGHQHLVHRTPTVTVSLRHRLAHRDQATDRGNTIVVDMSRVPFGARLEPGPPCTIRFDELPPA